MCSAQPWASPRPRWTAPSGQAALGPAVAAGQGGGDSSQSKRQLCHLHPVMCPVGWARQGRPSTHMGHWVRARLGGQSRVPPSPRRGAEPTLSPLQGRRGPETQRVLRASAGRPRGAGRILCPQERQEAPRYVSHGGWSPFPGAGCPEAPTSGLDPGGFTRPLTGSPPPAPSPGHDSDSDSELSLDEQSSSYASSRSSDSEDDGGEAEDKWDPAQGPVHSTPKGERAPGRGADPRRGRPALGQSCGGGKHRPLLAVWAAQAGLLWDPP